MGKQLWTACEDRNIEEVRRLLQNEQINTNWQNDSYSLRTALFIVCEYGYIEIVKLLLNDKRVDVNRADNYGWTPFHLACRNGHIEVVKLLLNNHRRVDINKAINDAGWTPFYSACYYGYTEIVKLLLNDQRVDINKAELNGRTPLEIACPF